MTQRVFFLLTSFLCINFAQAQFLEVLEEALGRPAPHKPVGRSRFTSIPPQKRGGLSQEEVLNQSRETVQAILEDAITTLEKKHAQLKERAGIQVEEEPASPTGKTARQRKLSLTAADRSYTAIDATTIIHPSLQPFAFYLTWLHLECQYMQDLRDLAPIERVLIGEYKGSTLKPLKLPSTFSLRENTFHFRDLEAYVRNHLFG